MRKDQYWLGEGDNDNGLPQYPRKVYPKRNALAFWHWTLLTTALLLIAFVIFSGDEFYHYLIRSN